MTGYVEGDLLSGDDLRRAATIRKRRVYRVSVPHSEVEACEARGFSRVATVKTRVRLERPKEDWKLLEDDIWLLLYRLGFSQLNSEGRFFILIKRRLRPDEETRFEVDVIGLADENVFLIECATSERPRRKSLANEINRIASYKSRLDSAVKKHFDNRNIRVSHILATRGIEWRQSHLAEAHENHIYTWGDAEFEYLDKLADLYPLIGDAVRYQLYAVMFADRKIKALEGQRVASIRGKVGKLVYYSFLATPEEILRISYVHRRVGPLGTLTLEGITEAYQRLLRPKKIREIDRFITHGEFFPNSVTINLRRPVKFEAQASKDLDFQYGVLRLPCSYGSAWIIDGQHRLFGYARNERRFSAPIPVIAFQDLEIGQQAKMFVDINLKQTRVGPNLLWDLKGDIYEESEEPKQRYEYVISHVVRNLNSSEDSSLFGQINVPGAGIHRPGNITMTTLCANIKKNRLVNPEMLGDTELTIQTAKFASGRIAAFFRTVATLFSDDWNAGRDGYTRSNDGIAALLIVLRQVLRYLYSRGQQQLYRKKNLSEFEAELTALLMPAVDHLKDASVLADFKRRFGAGGQLDSAQELCWQIRAEFSDFPLPRLLEQLPLDVEEAEPDPNLIDQLIRQTEVELRSLVLTRLQEAYGGAWYRRGLPQGVKSKIRERLEAEYRRRPYLRAEIDGDPTRRLEYSDLGHLKDIICYGDNWQLFESGFITKPNVEQNFTDYIDLRNAYLAHPRTVDEVVWNKGRGAILWFRKCLNL